MGKTKAEIKAAKARKAEASRAEWRSRWNIASIQIDQATYRAKMRAAFAAKVDGMAVGDTIKIWGDEIINMGDGTFLIGNRVITMEARREDLARIYGYSD